MTLVLIGFWLSSSQCLCECLCLCMLICCQGFCFYHTVSVVYGELFASQDVYSASFLPTALHICCHFITDIYLTLCGWQGTLDKSHCYFVCFHTPEWKEMQKMVLFSTSCSYRYWYKQQHSKSVLSVSMFSVKENQVSVSWCVLSRYSTFIQSPPSNQTEVAFQWLFLPSQSHCDRLLLVRPPVCRLSLFLFDWLTGGIMFVSSACLPDCLSSCLNICQYQFLKTLK